MAVTTVCLAVWGQAVSAQTPPVPVSRVENVARLVQDLRTRDYERYLTIEEEWTRRLLNEVDEFVSESFSPDAATADQVKAGLDTLVGHTWRDVLGNAAFLANLPGGQALIIAVELPRGGQAASDDVMSLRAYQVAGKRYVVVGSTSLEGVGHLQTKPLSKQPVGGEFWFAAWARLSAPSPPRVGMRLLAFNGERFRTVWSEEQFLTPYVDLAVQITPDGGFTLRTMPDFRQVTVINKQYAVTADGPQKVTEWQTEER